MVIDADDIRVAFDLPPEKAIAYLKEKGYTITGSWDDLDAAAHQTVFTVASIAQADVLMDIKGMLEQSLEKGQPFGEFKKQLRTKLADRGWLVKKGGDPTQKVLPPSRVATIYRTNIQSAYMAGRRAEQLETIKTRPYWQFVAVGDARTSSVCREQDGKVYRADDPIWAILYPPNHYNCRSRVRTLSEKQLGREGLEISEGSESDWKPAEGFNAPTGEWTPDLSKYPKDLQAQVEARLDFNEES